MNVNGTESPTKMMAVCLIAAVHSQSALAASPLRSFSAPPGTTEREAQPVLTPLGSGCTVLIIGASRGIGLELAKQASQKGCDVIATHREPDPPPALAALGCSCLRLDVADAASFEIAASELRARGTTLTHLIHNAGIYGPKGSLDGVARHGRPAVPPVRAEDMSRVFEVNSIGPLLAAQHFSPLLAATPAVPLPILAILTSKVGSIDDNTSGGAYAYRASKAALNMIAKSLYCDLRADGTCTVLLLHPGWVRTDMTDNNGLIDVDECVAGLLRAIEATGPETPFRFVDYKAQQIPW